MDKQHPGAAIITSFSGLGPLTGTGMLAEIGNDRSGFTDARGLKAYAAPVPRASGSGVLRHRVKNQRLAAVGYTWAFAAPTALSPGAYHDRRRNLYDRLLGYLHQCLATRQPYDEATAFSTTSSNSQATAA